MEVKKYLNKKLKLNKDRIENIRQVVYCFETEVTSSNNGVCIKCYRTIEKVIQMQSDMVKIKSDINSARNAVCENYKLTCSISAEKRKTEKRLLYSPSLTKPMKHQKLFSSEVSVVHLVNLPTFNDIIAKSSSPAPPNMPLEKTARRSLGFSETRTAKLGKETPQTQGSDLVGEVKPQRLYLKSAKDFVSVDRDQFYRQNHMTPYSGSHGMSLTKKYKLELQTCSR